MADGGDLELSTQPKAARQLPAGSFFAVPGTDEAAARPCGHADSNLSSESPGSSACCGHVLPVWQHTQTHALVFFRPPVRTPHGRGVGGIRAGRRKKSKKRRMEAALAGFKPSVRTDFDPLAYDTRGLTTPQHKR